MKLLLEIDHKTKECSRNYTRPLPSPIRKQSRWQTSLHSVSINLS